MTATIGYVCDDEHCFGFIERTSEGRWRAVGITRSVPPIICIGTIGFFATPERARAAVRVSALQSGGWEPHA